jgi:hypothetical protein
MIYTINNCIRAFGYTNFDNLIADMGSVDNLKAYVRANGYADIAVGEDTELLLVDVNGNTWHTGCYGAKLEPERDYLCFTLLEDYPESSMVFQPLEVKMSAESQEVNANKKYWYKVNNGEWIEFNVTNWNGVDNPHDLKKGDKVYIKGDAQNMNTNEYCYIRVNRDEIYMPKKIQVSGDLSSLYDFSDTIPEYGFNGFFRTNDDYTILTFKDLTFGSLTKLSPYCCYRMFMGNTTIKRAPELQATTLAAHCYDNMFAGCRTLNYVKAMFTDISAEGCLYGWLYNVSPAGTFVKNVEATYDNASANIPTDWTIINSDEPEPEPVPHDDYLCFTSHGQSTVKLTQQGNPYDGSDLKTIQYKLNDNDWQDWDLNEISLSDGDKMYLRGDVILLSESRYTYKKFVMTGSISASGNIMSLIDYSKLHPYEFCMLFSGCTALTQAPTLPATQLTEYCYYMMFNGCTSLTAAPELPATTLAKSCYYEMFGSCPITQAPALPATTLAESCYYYMFFNCTSLTTAPELPATTLANSCYGSMFYNCTSLTTAPALPATTLADHCYYEMFLNCTSLTTAPDLNAPELSSSCYSRMFNGCTNLNYVKALFNTIPSSAYTSDWLSGVSTTGTFVKNSKANWQVTGASGIPAGWTIQTVEGEAPMPDPHTDYLCLTAVNDGTTVQLYGKKITEGSSTTMFYRPLNYKINDGGWSSMEMTHTDMTSDKVTLNAGDKMYLKGDVSGRNTNEYMNIFIIGLVDCSGNINSINGFSTTATNNCFYKLFEGADIRKAAITFDFDTVYAAAFAYMFKDCTSLTTSPTILPTTTLDNSCYYSMFSGCTALTNAPELPATTLKRMCYSNMFKGCASLVTAPSLPATTLQSSCYSSMFYGCTSLVTAPELPATTLSSSCYNQMFYGCTKLNYIKAMFTTTPTTHTKNWVYGVSTTGTFVKNSSATWDVTGNNGIPTGWTIQTASPDK